MPIVQLDHNISLYYELAGNEQGEPVVFLSGLTGDHNNWQLQVQSLGDSYRCLSFDWRDTGYSSDSPTHDYTLVDLAQDVAGLIEKLALGRSHLVGLSMGGAVVQEVALNHPELVATLTLASSFAVRSAPTLLPASKRTPGNLRQAAAIGLHDTTDRLPALDFPTLVIAGARDHSTPPDHQQAYAALIPEAEFVLIEGAGHLVQVEKAGEFNRRLRAFLAAHPLRSA